jgi:hypothetical protein
MGKLSAIHARLAGGSIYVSAMSRIGNLACCNPVTTSSITDGRSYHAGLDHYQSLHSRAILTTSIDSG